MCRPYIDTNNTQGMQLGRFKNRSSCSLRVHLLHLISIMSFKLGHVSIPKRRIFFPLFLFCAYDSSVLQNFKIFTHLLPNFSYKDPRMTEVTYHCINFNDRTFLTLYKFVNRKLEKRGVVSPCHERLWFGYQSLVSV